MSILKLEQVCYRYDGSKINVLKNIDIEFERGVLYTIVGKSGAGISTLLSIISGLDTPTEGRIIYNGRI